MDIVMDISERIVVLNQGAVIADDAPENIRGDPDVQEAYLGGYEAGDLARAAEERPDETATAETDDGGVA
jgi:branched-chain amino acid transport system ATP-binding protein